MEPFLYGIAAPTLNGALGRNNDLFWKRGEMPSDGRFVQKYTTGHDLIMGGNTYFSIKQRNGRSLTNRRSIVLTQSRAAEVDGDDIPVASLEEAIAACSPTMTWVMGGEGIYRMFWPLIAELYINWINVELEGDRFLPGINPNEWKKTREDQPAFRDPKDKYASGPTFYQRRT